MAKEKIKQKEKELLELTSAFCTEKINEEYKILCEKLVKKMGRKRDVPFQRGNIEIWAAAVVYAIGSINFLFDKSFEPHFTPEQISAYFGTKNSTVANKAKLIRDMFNLGYYNPDFSTRNMTESNPIQQMVMVDGFIVPIDSLPEEYQQMVREARARGEEIEFKTRRT